MSEGLKGPLDELEPAETVDRGSGPAWDSRRPDPAVEGWRADDVLARFHVAEGALPPVVAHAAPLNNLAYELRHREGRPNTTTLRDTAEAAVKAYERALGHARVRPDHARAAHYIVCATIDDIVLSKPWGRRGEWARAGLVSTFHLDVTGGERVFDLLDHFHKDPGSHRDVLLLLYLCLSLGFEGRTRVSPRGTLELGQVREGLYRTLRGQFGAFERELSPHWRGVSARHEALRTGARVWALAGLLLLALALGYFLTSWLVSRNADTTLAGLASLASGSAPSLMAEERPDEAPVPIAAGTVIREPEAAVQVPAEPDPLDTIMGFLQPEVDAGRVSLTRDGNTVLVRIRSSGLFDEGSARVQPEFEALIDRIGRALRDEGLAARVIGHTDATPIRTARFPSNWQLSQARADAVTAILAQYVGIDRLTSEGRADTEPLAANETAEGRELNRRTEIRVLGRPSQTRVVPRSGPQEGEPAAP